MKYNHWHDLAALGRAQEGTYKYNFEEQRTSKYGLGVAMVRTALRHRPAPPSGRSFHRLTDEHSSAIGISAIVRGDLHFRRSVRTTAPCVQAMCDVPRQSSAGDFFTGSECNWECYKDRYPDLRDLSLSECLGWLGSTTLSVLKRYWCMHTLIILY